MVPLTTKVTEGSPYQLDPNQTLQASTALLKHIKAELERSRSAGDKKALLLSKNDNTADSDNEGQDDVAVWQIFTLKKHIVDKARLRPTQIRLPHTLNASRSSSVCLIVADPQREVKDAVADANFPAELRAQISRVIGYTKLKAKYKSFESRRQLKSEHDIFMADDRIASRLPETLGKTFFKGPKKPTPVRIATPQKAEDGKKLKKDKRRNPEQHHLLKNPPALAEEIEKALSSTSVYLSPSTTTALKVGRASFSPDKLAKNIEAVTDAMAGRVIVKGWRNIKAIHVKGPNTMAMPIWLADELWTDEADILPDAERAEGEGKNKMNKKRKAGGEADADAKGPISKKPKKEESAKQDAVDAASRKAKLLKQKSAALEDPDIDEFAGLMKRVRSVGSNEKKKDKVKMAKIKA